MTYSGLRIGLYFAIYFISTFSSADILVEPAIPATSESPQTLNSDLIEIEPEDENDDNDETEIFSPGILYDEQDDEQRRFFSFLDTPHEYITAKIESMARNLDDYFTTSSDFYVTSGSYLKLRLYLVFKERGGIEKSNSVSFKLRLPNTEKKLKIFFESPEEKKSYDSSLETKETPPSTVVNEGNYVLGIQGESGEKYGWKYKPTLGIDIDSKIDPFARFRFTRDYQFVTWNINWQETPYWYNSIGWGFDSYFELNNRISDQYLFRSATFAGWKYEPDNFDLSHVFTLFHSVNDKTKMSYYAGVFGLSKPVVYTTSFLLGINFRRDIHKNYLFFEVEPQIRYQKINRFHPEHSLTFRLEMVFQNN
jgi:hypothetical protein